MFLRTRRSFPRTLAVLWGPRVKLCYLDFVSVLPSFAYRSFLHFWALMQFLISWLRHILFILTLACHRFSSSLSAQQLAFQALRFDLNFCRPLRSWIWYNARKTLASWSAPSSASPSQFQCSYSSIFSFPNQLLFETSRDRTLHIAAKIVNSSIPPSAITLFLSLYGRYKLSQECPRRLRSTHWCLRRGWCVQIADCFAAQGRFLCISWEAVSGCGGAGQFWRRPSWPSALHGWTQSLICCYPKLGFCSLGLMLRSLRGCFELLGSFVRQHQEGLSIAHLAYFEKYGARWPGLCSEQSDQTAHSSCFQMEALRVSSLNSSWCCSNGHLKSQVISLWEIMNSDLIWMTPCI